MVRDKVFQLPDWFDMPSNVCQIINYVFLWRVTYCAFIVYFCFVCIVSICVYFCILCLIFFTVPLVRS